jgi:hypothetical protein
VSKISGGAFLHPVERQARDFGRMSMEMSCNNPETGPVGDEARIRRLALVPKASEPREPPLAGTAAVRRYRLARMERVAAASPADADRSGLRPVAEPERGPAEGLG